MPRFIRILWCILYDFVLFVYIIFVIFNKLYYFIKCILKTLSTSPLEMNVARPKQKFHLRDPADHRSQSNFFGLASGIFLYA